jgi:hypothetical protein
MAEQRSVLKFNGIDDHINLSHGFLDIDQSITITFWAKGENNLATETTLLEAVNQENSIELRKKSSLKIIVIGLIGPLSKMRPQAEC